MMNGVPRIGIVGASSLAGRELADVLAESTLAGATLVLLDDEEAAGQITATGDEAAVIQRLDESSYEGMDFAFFTGSTAVARAQWQSARKAGASIVDLTHALEGETGVPVRGPWIEEALKGKTAGLDLGTHAVVAAHPAAVMLGLVAARLAAKMQVAGVAATVLEPVSEHGQAAMDELHQQTVNLLSFQTLPRDQYDAQIAFNLLPSLGEGAKVTGRERIAGQYAKLSAGRLPELTVQLVYAPVFHGYTVSALVELAEPATVEEVEAALAGPHLDLVSEGSDPPSNLSAAGQDDVLARVRAGFAGARGRRFWVWLAADNLKLAALNAVACALELRRLRPMGTVQ